MILFTLLTDSEREHINRLIPAVARGDESALTALYQTAGGRLLSVALGVTRDLNLAEDALSESFLKVVRYAEKFRGGNGYAWLCTVVKNTALNLLKEQNRKRGANIDDFFHLTDGVDLAERSAVALTVEAALAKLCETERLCVWLKYFNDYTVREIAAETGLSKSSVQETVKKAEHKLRAYIQ